MTQNQRRIRKMPKALRTWVKAQKLANARAIKEAKLNSVE